MFTDVRAIITMTMHLLTEWESRTGKVLAWGTDERSEVHIYAMNESILFRTAIKLLRIAGTL